MGHPAFFCGEGYGKRPLNRGQVVSERDFLRTRGLARDTRA